MINVNNVIKKFRIPHEKRNSLFESVRGFFNPLKYETLFAINGISFEVKEGECIGIIGKNGSGKSTLLKMIAGIIKPDTGKIIVNGKIVPFLELGLGFNGELTARDNVYINGMLMGLSRNEIDEKFNDIIKFSELNNFLDTKLKNFSTGMHMRLAFSTAVHSEGDIYLIDEVLAVGDFEFQNKCFDIFNKFKKEGKTLIFVSHDLNAIKKFCDKIILLENGKIKNFGVPEEIISKYLENAG